MRYSEKPNTTLPRYCESECERRGPRDQCRETNHLRDVKSLVRSRRPNGSEKWGNEGAGYNGCLTASVAIGTSGRVARRVVLMERTGEEPKKEKRNNRDRLHRKRRPVSPNWMHESRHVRRLICQSIRRFRR